MNAVETLLGHIREHRFRAALRVWVRLGPDRLRHPALLETGAAIHRALGKTREEIALLRRLARALPEDGGVVCMLAETLEESGERRAAIDVLSSHLERRAPATSPAVEARLARGLARDGDEARAEALASSLEARRLPDPGVWRDVGTTWTTLGRPEAAIAAFERAIGLDPRLATSDVETCLSLAVLYESSRRLTDARQMAERVLSLAPGLPAARRVLMRLDHQQGDLDGAAEHGQQLLAARPEALSDSERSRTLLELAIVERRRGNPDQAFQHASDGNALAQRVFAAQGHDSSAWPALVDRIRAWRPSRRGDSAVERNPRAPVFLLGFPRSGTTLMQQILQCHPAIDTLDESDPAMGVLRQHFARSAVSGTYPHCLDALTDADWTQLRDAYWQRVSTDLGKSPAPVVIDKLPLNLVHVDALLALFPNARFLVMIRDPRDSVLSNFFQDYAPNDAMVQFTDLVRAAETYAQVMDLWLERRDALGDRWMEVRYEALAAGPESTEAVLREVLDFLAVDWDDAVLHHHEAAAKRVITTPSRYDVARPVYAHASGRWRRFQAHLAPVLPILAPYVEVHRYASDAA